MLYKPGDPFRVAVGGVLHDVVENHSLHLWARFVAPPLGVGVVNRFRWW